MKRLLIIFVFFMSMPAWSMCPIGTESVCNLPANTNSSMPIFQNRAGVGSSGVENSDLNMNNSDTTFRSGSLNSSFSQTQNQSGVQMQGSLGCQFGNCNQGVNNPFLPKQ